MKVPIFKELIINNYEEKYLLNLFEKIEIGKTPRYVILDNLPPQEAQTFLINMEKVMSIKDTHGFFPYPLYIVSSRIYRCKGLPLVKEVEDLPDYFFIKAKRPSNKELALLKKAYIYANKLSNISIRERLNKLQVVLFKHKELYNNCKETHFYKRIHENLKL